MVTHELKRLAIGATITAIVWGYALCAHAGDIDTILIKPYWIKVAYTQDVEQPVIQIVHSQRIVDRQHMRAILGIIMAHRYYSVVPRSRSLLSYMQEWRAHNFLCERAEAKDNIARLVSVDLEEFQPPWMRSAYALLSAMYGPHNCDSMTCPGYEPVEIIELESLDKLICGE